VNGDCLTDLDVTATVSRHEEADAVGTIALTAVEDTSSYGVVPTTDTGAVATIALAAVEDTSSYGVVPTTEAGEVEAFIEKQPGAVGRINAGTYILEEHVLELIPSGRAVSIEREIFPLLVRNGLYGFHFDDYWIDIGTPDRYLEATFDLLAGRVESDLPPRDVTDSLIYDGCITSGARIGPLSVIGRHCSVGDGSTVERSPTEQWRPTTLSGPIRAPLVTQPSYTSESVSSRGGRSLSTRPASRS